MSAPGQRRVPAVDFKPKCLATAVGSMPHKDPRTACRVVGRHLPEIPIWPQLPRMSFLENMYVQYSEGLPWARVDERAEKIHFETSQGLEEGLERFYESYLGGDLDYFAMSTNYARGFHETLEIARGGGFPRMLYLKGQITGPVSFGLTVTDEEKRSIQYNDALKDVVVKNCAMKARWQVERMKAVAPGVIIFIDEPYLASFGSAYISLSREDVVGALDEVVTAIHDAGALAGVHCCGNTDWSILMETGVDILNFDAYDYAETIALYPEELRRFLGRGGVLAWGVVPTTETVAGEGEESLLARFEEDLKRLIAHGFSREELLGSALITPSCGTGSLSVELSEKVFRLTEAISSELRGRHFGA